MKFINIITSAKYLVSVFCITVVAYMLVNLPASLLGKIAGQSGLTYNSAQGTVWHGRLTGISVDGYYFDHLDYNLHLKSIIFVDVYGSFTLVGENDHITGEIAGRTDGAWHFPQTQAITDIMFNTTKLNQQATISFKGQNVVVDPAKGCEKGQFQINSRLNAGPIVALLGQSILMTGVGHCKNGAVQINIASDHTELPLNIIGVSAGANFTGTVVLIKTPLIRQNIVLKNMLREQGFRDLGDHWVTDFQ